jgi:hypothetical protein
VNDKDSEVTDPKQELILTPDQLEKLMTQAVEKATAPLAEQISQLNEIKAPVRKMNMDYQQRAILGQTPLQTQEDVYTLAAQVGPVSHSTDHMPTPPEFVVIRDFNEHKPLINDVESLGYVVELHGVEFHARWEPLNKEGVLIRDKEEPRAEAALHLLEMLSNTEPVNSRLYYDRWFSGKIVTGERQIDEMVEEDAHTRAMAQIGRIEKQVNMNGVMPLVYANTSEIEADGGGLTGVEPDLSRIDMKKIE